MIRPTVEPHFSSAANQKSFTEAFEYIKLNPNKIYKTGGMKEFTAVATFSTKGNHKGKKVIKFIRNNRESARTYECCWGSITNCNRTYIDLYTKKI